MNVSAVSNAMLHAMRSGERSLFVFDGRTWKVPSSEERALLDKVGHVDALSEWPDAEMFPEMPDYHAIDTLVVAAGREWLVTASVYDILRFASEERIPVATPPDMDA